MDDPRWMPAFVDPPARGRTVTTTGRVRLGDVGTDGRLRLDGLARQLQDVARDDSREAGVDGAWVVRRTAVEVTRRPRFEAEVALRTWCSGTGPSWAERRTDLVVDDAVVVRAVALWVHVDSRTGRPLRVPPELDAVWGEAAGGRRVRGRLLLPDPPPDASDHGEFPLRRVDLDVLGHVNNAVAWAVLEEQWGDASAFPATAVVEHRAALDVGDVPVVWRAPIDGGEGLWVVVGDEVRIAAARASP